MEILSGAEMRNVDRRAIDEDALTTRDDHTLVEPQPVDDLVGTLHGLTTVEFALHT